jgi:hypothetical protein
MNRRLFLHLVLVSDWAEEDNPIVAQLRLPRSLGERSMEDSPNAYH